MRHECQNNNNPGLSERGPLHRTAAPLPFDYYWSERYARVYRLPAHIASVARLLH